VSEITDALFSRLFRRKTRGKLAAVRAVFWSDPYGEQAKIHERIADWRERQTPALSASASVRSLLFYSIALLISFIYFFIFKLITSHKPDHYRQLIFIFFLVYINIAFDIFYTAVTSKLSIFLNIIPFQK
jgi:hypothetical protein